jgi:hypothetical protein
MPSDDIKNLPIEKRLDTVIRTITRFVKKSSKLSNLQICTPILTKKGMKFYFEFNTVDCIDLEILEKKMNNCKTIKFSYCNCGVYINKKTETTINIIGYLVFGIDDLHYLNFNKCKYLKNAIKENNHIDFIQNEICNNKDNLEFYDFNEKFLCKFIDLYSMKKEGKYFHLIKQLLNDKYNIYEEDVSGKTPLKLAIENDLHDVLYLLVNAKIKVEKSELKDVKEKKILDILKPVIYEKKDIPKVI